MSKDPIELTRHIQDECFYLLSLTDSGLTEAKFLNDETLKRATVRSLEIIGEAGLGCIRFNCATAYARIILITGWPFRCSGFPFPAQSFELE